ncbi:MAG: Flp pilus assembly protein TadG [Microvirga sp.]|jgi:Flp pilus assembly pilin Flp|nr:Flp pilus assembly protein TadG [Microvirga sp.]
MSATRMSLFRAAAADARGATTAEFGLVAGFLFLILFAITDLGFAFWQWSSATKALQLGARLAAVSDPISSDLKTMTGLSSTVFDGDPMPSYARVCSGASKSCSGGTFDETALNTLVYGRGNTSCPTAALSFPAMCQIFSRIKPENVIVEYVHTGLGYAGRPGGPIPTIRLRLTGLSYEFIALNSLMGLPAIAMSGLSATATAEDLSGK